MSVIVPAYNEQKTISGLLEKLYTSLSASKFSFLIIVVDDGSSDCTLEEARTTLQRLTTANNYQVIPSIALQSRQGLGHKARPPIRVQRLCNHPGADLEYEPDDIVTMLETAKAQNLDVLYGSRFLIASNQHSYRRFYWGGQIVSFFSNFLYRQRLTDEPTCYKLFRTNLLKSLDLTQIGH